METVLVWLKEQGLAIAARNYHLFLTRVLYRMPLAQARFLGVNATLLRAIRVRLKLTVDPRGFRVVVGARSIRRDCRRRRRALSIGQKPKPAAKSSPPPRLAKCPRHDALQFPLPGMAGLPKPPKDAPVMRGTPEKPQGYGDWKIINEIARAKLRAIDNRIMTNWDGLVLHAKTRKEYTPEELVAIRQLTPNEAQSCFMTFNDATP